MPITIEVMPTTTRDFSEPRYPVVHDDVSACSFRHAFNCKYMETWNPTIEFSFDQGISESFYRQNESPSGSGIEWSSQFAPELSQFN
jgi:hypothetical protein